MGGSALGTQRLNKQDYFYLVEEISLILTNKGKGITFYVLPSYRQKSSFGDMDILILDKKELDKKEFIQGLFSPSQYVSNGPVKSFEHKEFQIDFIFTPEEDWESSKDYYSWNDLGNLLGKISHQLGLKFGHRGLEYNLYSEEGGFLESIVISKDISRILPFIGCDYSQWIKGFSTEEDIYQYVTRCKFFNRDIFQFDNLSSKHKHRNKKRKMYLRFLEYIESKELPNYDLGLNREMGLIPFSIGTIVNSFQDFKEKVESVLEKERRRNLLKEKFNGSIIMKKYGYEGSILGNKIKAFKNTFSNIEEFEEFILNSNDKEIWQRFRKV